MYRSILVVSVAFAAMAVANTGWAQDGVEWRSVASRVMGTYTPEFGQHDPESMAAAARRLLQLLDADQRSRAHLPLRHPERKAWTNLPPRADAGGVTLGQMHEAQVKAVCDLLARLFSRYGYEKFRDIMLADDQLVRPGRRRPGFGAAYFAIVLFGDPAAEQPWAFQIDGHHLGVNVALNGNTYSASPSFIGAQPFSFQLGDRDVRPLGRETDIAHRLIQSMTDDQIRVALTSQRRGFIRTGPGKDGFIPDALGLDGERLDDAQRQMLAELIAAWVQILPEEHADRWMKTIERDLNATRFAWQGGIKTGDDMSFSIQGPAIIIEYACQDLGGVPTDHIHTMLRNPTSEYGRQLESDE